MTETYPAAWQPIETAPRHYMPILLRQEETVGEGCHASHLGWEFFNPAYTLRRHPTHWMPLPQAYGDGELPSNPGEQR